MSLQQFLELHINISTTTTTTTTATTQSERHQESGPEINQSPHQIQNLVSIKWVLVPGFITVLWATSPRFFQVLDYKGRLGETWEGKLEVLVNFMTMRVVYWVNVSARSEEPVGTMAPVVTGLKSLNTQINANFWTQTHSHSTAELINLQHVSITYHWGPKVSDIVAQQCSLKHNNIYSFQCRTENKTWRNMQIILNK